MADPKWPALPEKWQRDLAEEYEKNGYKVERSILGIQESWNELEADEGLFSLLARDLAGEELDVVLVYDIMTSYETFRAIMGEQVYGIILLFECKEGTGDRAQRAYNKELQQRFYIDEDFVNREIFFALQRAPNSCGTHALLSIILNIPNLPLTPRMQEFKDFTKQMPPEARGYAISNHPTLAAYHNRRAPPSLDIADNVKQAEQRSGESSRAGHHFVTVQQNHFVPYVPIKGKLMELDGMKDHPINHGDVTPDNWIEICHRVITDRITKTTEQTRKTARGKGATSDKFNVMVMAVRASQRSRFIRELGSVQAQETALFHQLSSAIEEAGEDVPEECNSLVSTYRNRPEVPIDPAKVPTDLPPDPGILSPVCQQILELLATVRDKLNNDLEEKSKLLETYAYRVSGSPVKNGFSSARQYEPISEPVNGCNSDTSEVSSIMNGSQNYPALNGCVRTRTSESLTEEAVPENPCPIPFKRICPGWPILLPLRPDVTELRAAFAKQPMEKIQTRSQKITITSPAVNAKPVAQQNVEITRTKGRKRSLSFQGNEAASPIKIKTEAPDIAAEIVTLPTPPPSVESTVVNGHTSSPSPNRKIVNTITKVGGSFRSSTRVHLGAPTLESMTNGDVHPTEIATPSSREKKTPKNREPSIKREPNRSISPMRTRSRTASRSSSTRRTPDMRCFEFSKNGAYVSIVRNPLLEAKDLKTALQRRLHHVSTLQNCITSLITLETRRSRLYKDICDENRTREEHARSAVEREFDHSQYITALLKRCFECHVFSADELAQMLPALKIPPKG